MEHWWMANTFPSPADNYHNLLMRVLSHWLVWVIFYLLLLLCFDGEKWWAKETFQTQPPPFSLNSCLFFASWWTTQFRVWCTFCGEHLAPTTNGSDAEPFHGGTCFKMQMCVQIYLAAYSLKILVHQQNLSLWLDSRSIRENKQARGFLPCARLL